MRTQYSDVTQQKTFPSIKWEILPSGVMATWTHGKPREIIRGDAKGQFPSGNRLTLGEGSATDAAYNKGGKTLYKVTYSQDMFAPLTVFVVCDQAPSPMRSPVVVVVDKTLLRTGLSDRFHKAYQEFKLDLQRDGHEVREVQADRVDINRTTGVTAAAHKGAAQKVAAAIAQAAGDDADHLVILGRVCIPYTGTSAPDGHADHRGAWPSDTYYAVRGTGTWVDKSSNQPNPLSSRNAANQNLPGDGKFDNNSLPPDAGRRLAVGRIDFAGLGGFGVSGEVGAEATKAEAELMASYFDKLHRYKSGQDTYNRAFLVDASLGDYIPSYLPATDDLFVGRAVSNRKDPAKAHNLAEEPWMYVLVTGPGARQTWTNGVPAYDYVHCWGPWNADTSRRDFGGHTMAETSRGPHLGVFYFVFGSYVGDWDCQRSTLRTCIAEPTGRGLCSMYAGRPQPVVSAMSSGGTSGNIYLDSLASGTNTVNLHGDPTLREKYLKPVEKFVKYALDDKTTVLAWTAEPGDAFFLSVDGKPTSQEPLKSNCLKVGASVGTDFQIKRVRREPSHSGGYHCTSLARSAEMTLPGDLNFDLAVDAADLGKLSGNFRKKVESAMEGDINMDGVVDVADLGLLSGNFRKKM